MRKLVVTTTLLVVLICSLTAAQALAVGHYQLAFWREIGFNENSGNHSIFVWVWDEHGYPKPGVKIYTTWNVLLATTDVDGRAEVIIDVQNDHYDLKCVDTLGSESDVAPDMTSRRWPTWGHYSYEVGFMFKEDKSTPGDFDTSLYGTLNTSTNYDTDAPYTKSLAYYSTHYANTNSDAFALSSWVDSHGQTFVATGDRVAAVQFHGAIGSNYFLSWTAEILEGGPNGARVAGPKTIPVRQPILWVLPFGRDEAPIIPGNTYYLKITRSGGLNTWVTGNNYLTGSYHLNGTEVPGNDLQGFVCCMTVGESSFGTISGTVRSGSTGLSGAIVTAEPGGYSQQSQPDGTYSFTSLPQGAYTVSVFKPGYSAATSGPHTVEVGQTTTVDFSLNALTNRLTNPGFESSTAQAQIGPPWVTFGNGLNCYNSGNFAVPSHSGSKFAGAITSWGAFNGGAYQVVSATAGHEYTASAYVFSDSWQGGDRQNEYPGNCRGRVGIDPTGGTNPAAGSVVWSPYNSAFNSYGLSTVTATAAASTVTVFLQYTQTEVHEWNKSAFDDVYLTEEVSLPTVQITNGPSVSNIGTNSATVSWETNVAADSRVDYGLTSAYGQFASEAAASTSHSILLTGLSPGQTYHYKVLSAAPGYNPGQSSDLTFETVSAPQVSITVGPTVTNITSTSARITWSTNVASTSQIDYGETDSYGQVFNDPSMLTVHSFVLTELQPNRIHHYKVTSTAPGYADGISSDKTFTTPALPGTLQNPGFEQQEAYWTRYGMFDDGGDNGIQGTGWYFGFNPKDGVNFAGSAASYGIKSGGFYQRLAATNGTFYKFSSWLKTYAAGGAAPSVNNRIGIDPYGGTVASSANIVWSDRFSPSEWQQVSIAAKARAAYITVFLDAQQLLALEWNINAFDACSLEELSPVSIGAAKQLPDDAWVALSGRHITASFDSFSYIQDPDASSGIRISAAGQDEGAVVDIVGVLHTVSGERELIPSAIVATGTASHAAPVGMNNLRVGGMDWLYSSLTGAGQRGVEQGHGLNNIGRLVRTWGVITSSGGGWFKLDDGSGVDLTCAVPADVEIDPLWNYVEVTGISSCEIEGPVAKRLLRVRSLADIEPLL